MIYPESPKENRFRRCPQLGGGSLRRCARQRTLRSHDIHDRLPHSAPRARANGRDVAHNIERRRLPERQFQRLPTHALCTPRARQLGGGRRTLCLALVDNHAVANRAFLLETAQRRRYVAIPRARQSGGRHSCFPEITRAIDKVLDAHGEIKDNARLSLPLSADRCRRRRPV